MTQEIEVYVLSVEDCEVVCNINKKYPHGPQMIICDHGVGPCLEKLSLENPMYSEWRSALDALVPFSSRTPVTVTLDSDI